METSRVDGVNGRRVADLVVHVHAPHLRRDAVPLLRGDLFLFVGLFYCSSDLLDAYVVHGVRCAFSRESYGCMGFGLKPKLSITPVAVLAPGAQTGITV